MPVPRLAEPLPEIGDGLALQRQHEPEDEADDGGHGDDCPEEDRVHPLDGEAEEGESDGDLGDDAGKDVARLAEPPPLGISARVGVVQRGLTNNAVSMFEGFNVCNLAPIPYSGPTVPHSAKRT